MRTILALLIGTLLSVQTLYAEETELNIESPSAILMEASTGKVIYEKNADDIRPPASVTKVMTMLLILDEVEKGSIRLDDEVTTSEYAASMGGSQVFLEAGEVQTVDTLLKCIAVASGNDACVCMAEHIGGTEEEFVNRMNQRAKDLGMLNTNFVNCNGLDAEGHVTTARDIALMSKELITKHPEIEDYVTIWMENITHTTAKGSSEFGLSNTNKLIRHYEYATGLKTGSTSDAMFCVSATARKNQMDMIAVIMGAPDSKTRFKDATTLLNHGFAKCMKYIDEGLEKLESVEIKNGTEKTVNIKQEPFEYIDTEGHDLLKIEKKIKINKKITAPIKSGEQVGEMEYYIGDERLGSTPIVAIESIGKMNYKTAIEDIINMLFL